MTSAPGDPSTLYVVEQPGTIKVVRDGQVAGTFLDIRDRVKSGGEQRRRVTGDRSHARQLLFVDQPHDNHNGGQLQFDAKGFLYVGSGDGRSGGDPENRAQNLKSRLGKLLRIGPARARAISQIVGYGLRNPWRFSFDKRNGNLWTGDVGQNALEEIDFRPAAKIGTLTNYGRPKFEVARDVRRKPAVHVQGAARPPVQTYSHGQGRAFTGGYVVGGRYYDGDFCSGTIWSFRTGNGRLSAPAQAGHISNLSSFGLDGDGTLYAASLDDGLYKLAS